MQLSYSAQSETVAGTFNKEIVKGRGMLQASLN